MIKAMHKHIGIFLKTGVGDQPKGGKKYYEGEFIEIGDGFLTIDMEGEENMISLENILWIKELP